MSLRIHPLHAELVGKGILVDLLEKSWAQIRVETDGSAMDRPQGGCKVRVDGEQMETIETHGPVRVEADVKVF